ncbi:MAG TPA: hypothetical protein VLF94_06825 [Chlamydiales bacterium]|nr:hypothetical protein [Chlamydiales bacterium]
MTCAAYLGLSPARTNIAEDSIGMKALCCLPLVGSIVTVFQEKSLAKQLEGTADPVRVVELIEVKNDYKKAAVVGDVATVALLVAGIALGVIGHVIFSIIIGLRVISAAIRIFDIHKNNVAIDEVRSTGVAVGTRFL